MMSSSPVLLVELSFLLLILLIAFVCGFTMCTLRLLLPVSSVIPTIPLKLLSIFRVQDAHYSWINFLKSFLDIGSPSILYGVLLPRNLLPPLFYTIDCMHFLPALFAKGCVMFIRVHSMFYLFIYLRILLLICIDHIYLHHSLVSTCGWCNLIVTGSKYAICIQSDHNSHCFDDVITLEKKKVRPLTTDHVFA